MDIVKRVTELVEEKMVEMPGVFLVEVKMHPGNKLIILVDGDEAVTISDCAAISRHVGFHLEEEQAIPTAYNLEVGSPGVGEPLKLKRQYNRNIGRTIGIRLADGSLKEGELKAVGEDSFTLLESVKPAAKSKNKKASLEEVEVAFADIAETKVLISFK
ncbi:MAG: ribosome assembly cofactor RimP [Chitinophagaceae bacterium]|nr:MAG: ribosome assembly cofactor RimP [Chitinophagaceae bacterium]